MSKNRRACDRHALPVCAASRPLFMAVLLVWVLIVLLIAAAVVMMPGG